MIVLPPRHQHSWCFHCNIIPVLPYCRALGLSGCAASEGTCQNCATLKNQGILSDEQTEKCTNVDGESSVPAIAQGTRRAILECQSRFDNNRWNCTTFEGNNLFGSFVSDSELHFLDACFSLRI